MYPNANISVIQMYILESLDPEEHFKMGKYLSELKNQGFLSWDQDHLYMEDFGKIIQFKSANNSTRTFQSSVSADTTKKYHQTIKRPEKPSSR